MRTDRALYHLSSDWLTINGNKDAELAKTIYQRVADKITAGKFVWENVGYVSDLSLKATGNKLNVSKASLEKLRRACQLWEVDLRYKEITSHRKLIGPVIVAFKKLIFPIMKLFLKDTLRQQRAFNSAILAVCLDLYEQKADAENLQQIKDQE